MKKKLFKKNRHKRISRKGKGRKPAKTKKPGQGKYRYPMRTNTIQNMTGDGPPK